MKIYPYYENLCTHGIRAEFGDAIFTFLKVTTPEIDVSHTSFIPMCHSHFFYECHILLEGEYQYKIQGTSVSVSEGSIIIIQPYDEHFPFDDNDEAKEIVLGFILDQKKCNTGAFSYFLHTLLENSNKAIPLSKDLVERIKDFYDRFDKNDLRDMCMQQSAAYTIITQLFDSINRFHIELPVNVISENDESINITLEVMINDVRYSQRDIAESLGYSTRHVSRLIQQKYGKSFMEIRQKNMISTAKKLFYNPDLTFEEVSEQAGFSSVEAMTRAFRKWEKQTPSEYKKRLKTK